MRQQILEKMLQTLVDKWLDDDVCFEQYSSYVDKASILLDRNGDRDASVIRELMNGEL